MVTAYLFRFKEIEITIRISRMDFFFHLEEEASWVDGGVDSIAERCIGWSLPNCNLRGFSKTGLLMMMLLNCSSFTQVQ